MRVYMCLHCPAQFSTSTQLDMHLRFTCEGLGRDRDGKVIMDQHGEPFTLPANGAAS